MKNTDRKIDQLPDKFASEDEASEFWSTHSITDYEDFMEPVDLNFDPKRRHFEIEVDEETFLALRAIANKRQKPVKQIAGEILKRKLEAA
ncbi:MAG: CopG family antitoxin [Pseudomonadota bacterium]